MKNVYQIGSGELTFDIIEQIISENLKLELAPEARRRIQTCRNRVLCLMLSRCRQCQNSSLVRTVIRHHHRIRVAV